MKQPIAVERRVRRYDRVPLGDRAAMPQRSGRCALMLAPNIRLSTYDILKPPAGWSVDALLACTYSAALDTVLSFPAAIHSETADNAVPGTFTAADLAEFWHTSMPFGGRPPQQTKPQNAMGFSANC